jgi:DNA-binding HxlR family transcriptional regulator
MTDPTAEVLHANCPSRLILDQVADKWSILILSVLRDGPLRFNVMKRRLEGITQKSLTQALRRLERNGIVARRVITTSPVAVEYSVTPLGETLKGAFQALHAWTVTYMPEIARAQQAFDQREDVAEPLKVPAASVAVAPNTVSAGAPYFPAIATESVL